MITKYKKFENISSNLYTEEKMKDIFKIHLLSEDLKNFFNKYDYPFFPFEPIIEYNNDKKNKCILTYIFKNININSYTKITYIINYKNTSKIGFYIYFKVIKNYEDKEYILINYEITNYLSNINFNKSTIKFYLPKPPLVEGSFGFLNLKIFIIDLKLIPILNKYKSNKNTLNTEITTGDKDYYNLIKQLDLPYFQIQKRNDEWIYFDYRDVYYTLSKISIFNEIFKELHVQYMIHEQYLPKIIRLYKEIKKEVENDFNN